MHTEDIGVFFAENVRDFFLQRADFQRFLEILQNPSDP